jgi:hypothetical protein
MLISGELAVGASRSWHHDRGVALGDDPIRADAAALIDKGGSECELVEAEAELKRYLKGNDLKDREKVKAWQARLEPLAQQRSTDASN